MVHAQGGFGYTLSNSGGVKLTPGNPGSTTIIATLTAGIASNVTLSCDFSNLPTGTTCSFTPTSVIPTLKGNGTILTMTVSVPATTLYSAFNVTVTAKTGSPAPIAPTVFTLTVAGKIAVDPTATASLSYTVGTSIPVDFNMTNSPPFGGFIVAVFFNTSVLQFSRLDYSGNGYVFGNDPNNIFFSTECLNGFDVPGGTVPCVADTRFDDVGVLSLDLATNSGLNTTTPTGILFSVVFNVVGTGFSAFHIVDQEAFFLPNGIPLKTVGYDGYFTNKYCGGGNLCKPPVVSVTPPLRPIEFRPASFNSTAVSQNSNGYISEYNWTWGTGAAKAHFNANYSPGPTARRPPTSANITFGYIGEFLVTLSVQDNYDARAYYTLEIVVFRVWIDLGLSGLTVDNSVGVFPGTLVHIVATATNNGVNPENSTIRLSIDHQNVATLPVTNLGPALGSSLSYAWHTTGLTPKVYRVDVTLDEVRNGTGPITENDTTIIRGQLVDPNNARVAIVQLISPLPNGFGLFLGLNLPETVGLGIVLAAVAGFIFGLVKKARAPPPEPL